MNSLVRLSSGVAILVAFGLVGLGGFRLVDVVQAERSPSRLVAYSGDFYSLNARVGQAAVFNTGIAALTHGEAVTLVSVTPHAVDNSSSSDIILALCKGSSLTDRGVNVALGFGSYCTSITPLSGQSTILGEDFDQVVVQYVPHSPGAVQINGYDVVYLDSSGVSHTQLAGAISVAVTA